MNSEGAERTGYQQDIGRGQEGKERKPRGTSVSTAVASVFWVAAFVAFFAAFYIVFRNGVRNTLHGKGTNGPKNLEQSKEAVSLTTKNATNPTTASVTISEASTVPTVKSGKKKSVNDSKLCNTHDCQYVRWLIDISVDETKDPCHNFHEFVCSGAEYKLSDTFTEARGGMMNVISFNLSSAIYDALSTKKVPERGKTGFEKAAAVFQHCLKVGYEPSANTAALFDFLKQYGLMLTEDLKFDPLDLLIQFMVKVDIPLLFKMEPVMTRGSSHVAIRMNIHPDLSWWRFDRVQMKSRGQYGQYVRNILLAILLKKEDEALEKSIIKSEDAVIQATYVSTVGVDRILTLPLSRLGYLGNDRAFGAKWKNLLERHTGSRLPGNRSLYIPKSAITFINVLFDRDGSILKADLQKFLAWRTTVFLFNSSGLEKGPDEDRCLEAVKTAFPSIVTSSVLFATVNQSRINAVQRMVNVIIREIRTSFVKSSWLDDTTRDAASKKLSLLSRQIGYLMGLSTHTAVDTFLEGYPDFTGPYLKDSISIRRVATGILWDEALSDSTEYVEGMHMLASLDTNNAVYLAQRNMIFVPPAIMQTPVFTYGAPPEVNFGSLGRVVSHEVMHGYDDRGRWFDGYGNTSSWWTKESEEEYRQRVECHSVSIGKKRKARRFLDYPEEYLADTMGEESILSAYRRASMSSSASLGDVKGLTNDQLFYVAWCLLWCGRNAAANAYQPPDERCNLLVMNSAHFGEVFSCPSDAPMNPRGKCRFW